MEDPDELIACPFEPVHMLQRKRMPYHIIKCRKNQPQKHFRVCPFNHRHIVHQKELENHLRTCPDQGIVERELTHRKNLCAGVIPLQKGYTNVPVSSFSLPDSVEDWDDSNVTVAIGPYNSAYSSTDSGSSSLSNSGRERAAIVTRGDKEPFSQRLPFTTGSMSEVFQVATSKRTDPNPTDPPPSHKARGTLSNPPPSVRTKGRGRGCISYTPRAIPIQRCRMDDHVPMGVEEGLLSGCKVGMDDHVPMGVEEGLLSACKVRMDDHVPMGVEEGLLSGCKVGMDDHVPMGVEEGLLSGCKVRMDDHVPMGVEEGLLSGWKVRMEDHVPMGVEEGLLSAWKVGHGRGTTLLQANMAMEVGRRVVQERLLVEEKLSLERERNDKKLLEEEQERKKAEEERKKRGRKLKKMMRQIMELEEKQAAGQPLDNNQLDKMARKEDVQHSLQQFEQGTMN